MTGAGCSSTAAARARTGSSEGTCWPWRRGGRSGSLGQFGPETGDLRTAEDCLDRAGKGELCFVETMDPAPWLERMEGLVLYRWNRRYPADLYCTLPLEDFVLEERREFAGSSHECITREVYRR